MAAIVELLVEETRTCDYLGRLVDDRLMAVLPHTDRRGGETVAMRLLQAGRERTFAGSGSPLKITLSIGLSHYEKDNTLFFDSLIDAADSALGKAVAGGGDQFVYQSAGPVSQTGE